MAFPSVTYTFGNGTSADATQVNQNFTDVINGASDGTKSYNINALTAAGLATFNGNVSFTNAAILTWGGGFTMTRISSGFSFSGGLQLSSLAILSAQSTKSITLTDTGTITSLPLVVSGSGSSSPAVTIIRGRFTFNNASSTLLTGEGFTIAYSGANTINVTFTNAFTDAPTITTGIEMAYPGSATSIYITNVATTGFTAQLIQGGTPLASASYIVAFAAIGAR